MPALFLTSQTQSAGCVFATFMPDLQPTTGCGARSASLWAHRNLFWPLPRDGNLHGSGRSHATTAYPKPSSRTPWREYLPMPELLTRASCRKDWKKISAKSSVMSPLYPVGQGTELNWMSDFNKLEPGWSKKNCCESICVFCLFHSNQ